MRRYGDPVHSGQRYKRRPGVYAILMRGDNILTTYQSTPLPEIQLPGGGIDPGEHPIAALHREVFEETGWTIGRIRRFGTFRRYTFMPEYDLWAEKICTIFAARPGLRLGPPTEPDHDAVWMPAIDAVHQLGNEGDRAMLRAFLRSGI